MIPRTLLSLLLLTPALAAGEIVVERVFGPETKTGLYKHPSCIEELEGGDLYLVYYGGGGEYAEATAVWGSRRAAGSTTWTPPVKIASNPFRSLGNAVVWEAPDGVVWLFYVTRYGDTWSTSRIKAKISRDGARTWSDSFLLTFDEGTMVRGQPIVLHDGNYLLPIYHETGHDTELVGASSTSLFMHFDVKKKAWKQTGRIRSRIGNIQPAVVELSPGHLLAYCRRGGGYEPRDDGWLVRAESRDGGWTWSEGKDSDLPNPNAAVEMIKLASGRLALFYNHSMSERTPLLVAISTDGGKTFPHRRAIRQGPGSFSYPSAIQARDGRIHLVFTSDERTVVNHCVFEERDVMREASR